jgi:hypothetical protein
MLINGDSGETFNLFVKFFVRSASWFNQNLHQPEHCHFPQWALKKTSIMLEVQVRLSPGTWTMAY